MTALIIAGLVLVVVLSLTGYWMSRMPGCTFTGPLPGLSPADQILKENLSRHINMLAETIGERNAWQYDNALRAARYIEEQFQYYGVSTRSIEYEASGKRFRNIEAELRGTGDGASVVVIGAHYDSLVGTVGANDNASGVAALLELARLCSTKAYRQSVRFVAFANEEPPYFKSPKMGSLVYAQRIRDDGDHVTGMLALETLGFYTDEPLTQQFPLPLLRLFYPQEGNFIAFVGNLRSSGLLRESVSAFRANTAFPSEGIVAPGWLVGVDWSDHWSFWNIDVPAIMATDTALFRYPYYHTDRDTPDKINMAALARVTAGLQGVIEEMAR